MKPHHKRRGASFKWAPDPDSFGLLDNYRRGRLASSPRPAETTVRTECDFLRAMVRASISFGGPKTLRALRDDAAYICRVLREAPYTHHTLKGMHRAMLHLIDLTVPDPAQAERIKKAVIDGLIPRPARNRSWNQLPRTVGGSRQLRVRRPALTSTELRRVVKAARIASPDAHCAVRDAALVAVLCFSGLSPYEIRLVKTAQVQWLEPGAAPPWCAFTTVARRRFDSPIPVHEAAAGELWQLLKSKQPDEYLFASTRRRSSHPLSYSMVRRVRLLACRNAGLGDCDNVTLKRAYAAHLRSIGLRDFQIRDALGLKTMASLDGYLRRHRRIDAQQKVERHEANDPDQDGGSPWRRLPF